jgi:hypothetical protein
MTTSGTAHYAFPHSGTGERRRLDLLEDRLDPSRYAGPARSPCLLVLAAWRSAAAGDRSRAGCASTSAPTGMSPRPTCRPGSCPSCRWRISACFAMTCEPASSRQAPLTSFMCASSLCMSQTGWPRSGGWSPSLRPAARCWWKNPTSACGWGTSTPTGPRILVPGTRPFQADRCRKEGRCCARSTTWAWPVSAPTPSSTSCSRALC